MSELPKLYTVPQVAEYLGVNARTVKRLIRSGKLIAAKYGRTIRVLEEHLNEFRQSSLSDSTVEITNLLLPQESIAQSAVGRSRSICAGVYFLLDGNEIVYVGQSKNVPSRLIAHFRSGEMAFDRWWYQPCPERLLLRLEAHYISAFSPKYNFSAPFVEKLSCSDFRDIAEVQP